MKISNIFTKQSKWLLSALLAGIVGNASQAREIIGTPTSRVDNNMFRTMADGCKAPTAQVDLDINNVRTTIMNGGDMWWNLISAKYEIPKITDPNGIRKHSIFAGSLWIGGVDAGNNLKLAAMTYRQNGIDFFAGAVDSTASPTKIAPERCEHYDKIYKVTREEIDLFIKNPAANLTKPILDWPGNGNMGYGEEFHMAPYVNMAGGLEYNPTQGDYPDVKGDQALWFVYNDIGNIHSETQGVPIGLELKTTAFAFTTNDEINNMTFYSTEITNYGEPVKECYFGQWIDPDLGNYADDYVGCDTTRNLGYCYNGDDNDEGILGYGLNPPTVGLDFFKGPKDENGNELKLFAFMYYNNDFSVIGNPTKPLHYYNYLRALWQDGQHVTNGGNGRGGATSYNFMFDGDPVNNTGWTEKGAGNQPSDRRFLQSAGPLTLKTGARNEVTIGAVWARSSLGGATGSLTQLRNADDKAQLLFNNNFKLIDGPRSPDMSLKEYDNELILVLDNTEETEKYVGGVRNPFSQNPKDSFYYKFQGYQIYQLKDASVTTGDLDNTEKARVLKQMDVQDNITQIINRVYDPVVGQPLPVSKVIGNNIGIVHSFSVKEDLFATPDQRMVNFKQYHFMVVAYANLTNDAKNQNPEQYLAGRLNVKRYTGIPHKPDPTSGGSKINALYGSGPMIKRIEGQGNGGNSLELTKASIEQILREGKMEFPVYTNGYGPIKVTVIDPLKVPKADFEFIIQDTGTKGTPPNVLRDTNSIWTLTNKTTGKVTIGNITLKKFNEQIIKEYGFSISMKQPNQPGVSDNVDKTYGAIESSVEFSDPTRKWLIGVKDNDGGGYNNWIRAGVNGKAENYGYDAQGGLSDKSKYTFDFAKPVSPAEGLDPFENYEKICDGRVAPYKLCSRAARNPTTGEITYGPAFDGSSVPSLSENSMANLVGIDLVITPDQSKWTKCVVVEMSEDKALSEGNRLKWSIRDHASWTGRMVKDPSTGNYIPEYDPTDKGRSWFPGYAINIETGERLNIIMGENSWLKGYNGADMIWNPTADISNFNGPLWGGMHHVYVCAPAKYGAYTGPIYDEGVSYQQILSTAGKIDDANTKRQVTSQVQWVSMPYMNYGYNITYDGGKLNIPSEVRYRVRVAKPYAKYTTSSTGNNSSPYYSFNTNDIAVDHSLDLGKAAMDKINVVPNPYYGASNYENSQLDTRVKFINLPPKCIISIYSLSGSLVRQIKKDDELTYSDWDLKNQAQVPIASGLYIVHFNGYELGEKIVKWYGIMRPVDLDTF